MYWFVSHHWSPAGWNRVHIARAGTTLPRDLISWWACWCVLQSHYSRLIKSDWYQIKFCPRGTECDACEIKSRGGLFLHVHIRWIYTYPSNRTIRMWSRPLGVFVLCPVQHYNAYWISLLIDAAEGGICWSPTSARWDNREQDIYDLVWCIGSVET